MAGWRVNALLQFLPLRCWRLRRWSSSCGCSFVRLPGGGELWQLVWCPRHNPSDFRPVS